MRKSTLALAMASLFATSAYANGPANKVTGDFIRAADTSNQEWTCEFTAHEAVGKRAQKGSLYCAKVGAEDWWEVDLGASTACVDVQDDVKAILGGMAVDGFPASRAGQFYGMEVLDNGEGNGYIDQLNIKTFAGGDAFAEFCPGGSLDGGVSPYTVTEGNIQVHYYGTDGD